MSRRARDAAAAVEKSPATPGASASRDRTDDQILSIAEDIADESDCISLAAEPRILRSADGQTARVAAWVMVDCAQLEKAEGLP